MGDHSKTGLVRQKRFAKTKEVNSNGIVATDKTKKGNKKKRKKYRKGDNKLVCHNISCLNNIVASGKMQYDTVKNFLVQERRIRAKLILAGE